MSFPNDDAGISALINRLKGISTRLIVLEATGGYENAAVVSLSSADLPVVVVNPRQVRDFAKATGTLAKTDRVDAQILALFAARVRPAVRPIPCGQTRILDALLTRRRQLLGMITAEKNRLALSWGPIRKDVKKHVRWLKCRVAERR